MPKRIPYACTNPLRPRRPRPPDRREAKKERDAFYASVRWRRLRAAHLASHPLCEVCLRDDKLTEATAVHHVRERLEAPHLALDPDNLESICDACHTAEHNERRRTKVMPRPEDIKVDDLVKARTQAGYEVVSHVLECRHFVDGVWVLIVWQSAVGPVKELIGPGWWQPLGFESELPVRSYTDPRMPA
jgi:5-methylcytosine-specific restriction protein A